MLRYFNLFAAIVIMANALFMGVETSWISCSGDVEGPLNGIGMLSHSPKDLVCCAVEDMEHPLNAGTEDRMVYSQCMFHPAFCCGARTSLVRRRRGGCGALLRSGKLLSSILP